MSFFTVQLNARRVLWRKSDKPNEVWICHGNACLENGERTPDRRFRLGVNTKTGWAHCFNCRWGSKRRNVTLKALAHWFALDINMLLNVHDDGEQEEKKPVKFSLPQEFIPFGKDLDEDDEFEREAWNYITEKRKVPPEQVFNKRIGYAISGRYAYRILFPFWDENQSLAGVVGRSWSNSEPKYLNSMSELGFQRSFYNAHKLAKLHKKIMYTVVLTEGALDALAVERAGYRFALGTFGSVRSEEHTSELQSLRHLVCRLLLEK